MFKFILSKFIGTRNERLLKKMQPVVEEINALEVDIAKLSDAELRAKTDEFRAKLKADPENEARILEEILPEAFAVVREVGKRTVGMRHFDVQLVGGMVLHQGKIAEMATGEGKTLVATLAAYLNALSGKGVHVVTVNDYLARRDKEWMGPVYEFLGLSFGAIQHDMDPETRQKQYGCDITYGTNNEFGFDYLRDNMVGRKEDMVQRPLHYAIVDEVDSILVDEARTPLIISGPAEESTELYYKIDRLIPQFSKDSDYTIDEKSKTASLTEDGVAKAEKLLGVENLYESTHMDLVHHINQALRAHALYKRDVDYLIKEGKVVIVDEFTGRMMPGRRWSEGLHQAIEAKEGVRIERENQTLATITFQNLFRMYDKLSGMTGTAATEAQEFDHIYKLDVVVIPTNKPLMRQGHPDVIYKTEKEKFKAVVEEIAELHEAGRPVLVGTISIEKSEVLSSLLKRRGIPHNVLNAKYHEMEAGIVAQAGRYKGVTIATNMAGRGTDIVLGGNAEYQLRDLYKDRDIDEANVPPEELRQDTERIKARVADEHKKVVEAGGLHVLGTERHDARRIDNQLRGRSGRQGDPGSSRFYLSLQDDLLRIFGSDRIAMIMDRFGMEEGQPIEHGLVSRAIETAQKRVELHNFEIRKHLLEYDGVINKQREIIYEERRKVLEGDGLKEHVEEMIEEVLLGGLDIYANEDVDFETWDFEGLTQWIKQKFSVLIQSDGLKNLSRKELEDTLYKALIAARDAKETQMGAENMRQLEKGVMLHIIDSRWKEHLYAIDSLKEGIGLRAYGQRDPLVEYQHEGYALFTEMTGHIKEEIVEFIFKVQAAREEAPKSVFLSSPQELIHRDVSGFDRPVPPRTPGVGKFPTPGVGSEGSGPSPQGPPQQGPATYKRETPKVGRNDPCPCGSNKKYKKCCGR